MQNTEKQIAQCESTVKEDSFELSNHKISSTESKVRTTLQSKDAIIYSGCQMVKILCFWSEVIIQRAKKVVSDSPGLVDFAIGLVNSVFNLPDGQDLFGGIRITEEL